MAEPDKMDMAPGGTIVWCGSVQSHGRRFVWLAGDCPGFRPREVET